MIKIKNLSVKVHEENILKGVNLEIKEEEMLASFKFRKSKVNDVY